jgi:hypothetical protein
MLSRVLIQVGLAGAVGAVSGGGCDCSGGGFPADALGIDAVVAGTITATWSIVDLNGAPLPCDRIGATTVFLELRSRTRVFGVPVSLSCGLSPATSQLLPPDTYDVSFELHAGAATIAAAAAQNGVVVRPGDTTLLSPVAFQVDANGKLEISLIAPTTTNCRPVVEMGAGITTNTITLEAGGGCAPVTFTRSRGGSVVGTYVVNCSSPMITECIERDEVLTVPSLPSGPYTIHIRGKVNALDCWQNDDSFQVPALGATLDEPRNLAFRNVAGCVSP